MQSALTDQGYWDAVWTFTDDHLRDAPAIRVEDDDHHAHLDELFRAHLGPGKRFLEVGAGGSAWPAHVAARHGAEGWGIDFSRGGLGIAAACARRDGVRVELIEGDFFDGQKLPAGHFDVVYSGGFVEHFPDAAPLMKRMAELLKPGGVVVTGVPNLDGMNGRLQQLVDVDCYARHVVFTPDTLDAAHALGGLRPLVPARFWGVLDPGSVNFSRLASRLPATALKLVWAALSRIRHAGESVARRLGAHHGGRWLSPGLVGVYQR